MNILKIFGFMVLASGAYLLFDHLMLPWVISNQPQHLVRPADESPVRFTRPNKAEANTAFESSAPIQTSMHCDGRTHCSQMTSCAEARFFLTHCPDTKMDGDQDGIPCEDQWCEPPR